MSALTGLWPRNESSMPRKTSASIRTAGTFALTFILFGTSISSAYTRGRVRIANNTVVSDQGTLLRGINKPVCGTGPKSYCTTTQAINPATYQSLQTYRLNCVRLGIEYNRNWHADIDMGITERLPAIDSAVNLAERYGIYICIDYHECGSYDLPHLIDFWKQVAPRYKDRKHVLYELANEPVAWAPEDYNAQHLRDQKAVYDTIRKYAPNTMILVLDYATANNNMLSTTNRLSGIDYTNAAVAGHPYHVCDANGLAAMKNSIYPYISTEFADPDGYDWNIMCALQGDSWGWVKWHEANKVSWFIWSSSPILLINDATSRGYLWTPDDFSNPPVGAYLTVSPDSIYQGDSASLSWRCYQMTGASIDQGIGAVSLTGGSRYVKPTQNTTYTLTASGNGQTYAKSVTVYIKQRRAPENPAGTVAGLDYKYYEGTWTSLPNFTSLTPVKTSTVTNFDISVATAVDNFGLQFNGYINIPANGTYTFATASDDGSRLYIGTTLVANNDGGHAVTEASGQIGLQAGKHAIRVEYFEAAGGQSLAVKMNGQAIAAGSLFRLSGTGVALPMARTTVTTARELACYNIFGQRVGSARSSSMGVLLFVQKAGTGQTARMAMVGSSR